MGVSKDLTIATVVLVICVALLSLALIPAPEGNPVPDHETVLADASGVGTSTGSGRTLPPGDSGLGDAGDVRGDDVGFRDVHEPDVPAQPGPVPEPETETDTTTSPAETVPGDIEREEIATVPADLDESIGSLIDGLRTDIPDEDPVPSGPATRQGEERTADTERLVVEDVVPDRPAPPATGGGKTHTVAEGELLSDISLRYYGTAHQWRVIAQANDVEPRSLIPGTKLAIPDLPNVVPDRAHGTRRADGTYVVKKGESYWTIARDLLGDAGRYREIESLNTISEYDLMPGDVIKIPAAGPRRTRSSTSSPRRRATIPAGATVHTVGEGEILGDISKRYYGTVRKWRTIADANNIGDPRSIIVGQKLVIPGAERTASAAAPASTEEPDRPQRGQGRGLWHTIAKGDTLGAVSSKYYGTSAKWRKIRDANPAINPLNLPLGKKLWIPDANATGAAAARSTPAPRTPPRREREPAPRRDDTAPSEFEDLDTNSLFDDL